MGVCKVILFLNLLITDFTQTVFVSFIRWDFFSPAGQCSWTLNPGNMGSCWIALQPWQISHSFSSHRVSPGSCHRLTSPRWTRQEKTPCCPLTASPSALLMTPVLNVSASLLHSVRTFHPIRLSLCPVLLYSVTSTHTHWGFPLRLTGLASWSSTTSWTLPPCFLCWPYKSEMEKRFWIFAPPRGGKP